MDNKEYFTKTFSALNKLHLGEAIEFMKGYLKANPSAFTDQQIQVIEDDFGRMLDYMEQGYRDAERDKATGAAYVELHGQPQDDVALP